MAVPLVTIDDLTIRFRGPALLDGVHCTIEPGERIGLLGRNGAGKTTLLKLLAGEIEPDHGRISLVPGARVAMLPQEVPQSLEGSVSQLVGQGVASLPSSDESHEHAWQAEHRVAQILSRMQLDPDAAVGSMSSGMKRRVLLARALVDGPDLLLLDEPTNHLDIDAIRWLEDFLGRWEQAYVFITHDRQFLRNLATRILEIDNGKLFDWTCDYATFLRRKEEVLAAQEKQEALFDKKLAEEEAWIRQGIRARRTRNEGRVRALEQLRRVRSERREKTGVSNLQIQDTQRSGNLVANAEHIALSYRDASGRVRTIIDDFSCTIMRGDKIGIIGPNGAGKTTLLKLLLGRLSPDRGSIRMGTNLQIAYFDQLREQLDPSRTIEDEVGDGYQTIHIGGQPRHVLGYLQDFLFTPERARTPIRRLSGGERNRVLLAKLFAKPANVIVLDEPTNDLDAETLEMLENRLVDYDGTLLLVSHDREFLNNVVTSTIAFEESGDAEYQIREYVGGYDDWLRQSPSQDKAGKVPAAKSAGNKTSTTPLTKDSAASPAKSSPTSPASESESGARKRLTFKEQRELAELPGKIEQLEARQASLHEALLDPQLYKQGGAEAAQLQAELRQLEELLHQHYLRWEALDIE